MLLNQVSTLKFILEAGITRDHYIGFFQLYEKSAAMPGMD